MQAVIAIPDQEMLQQYGGPEQALLRPVCGVPLLVRLVKTAIRAGVDSFVVIWPTSVPLTIWQECRTSLAGEKVNGLTIVHPDRFRPRRTAAWKSVEAVLEERFVWLPWNWMTSKRALLAALKTPILPNYWSLPALIEKQALLAEQGHYAPPEHWPEGVPVTSPRTAAEAERLIIARSGKPLDGIYSTFNRWMCRPVVRWMCSARFITPNAITVAGLLVAIGSALMFARGNYTGYVAGALLFFLSGLCDEMDGMLARTKFKESAFGTWFEGFVDNATYLMIFMGMTIGLARQRGPQELFYGAALIAGGILAVAIINLQRKHSTDPARPNEYLAKLYVLLDGDKTNLISWATRHVNIFLKKAVIVHYLLLFALIGALPVFLRLAALGANLTWIGALYFSRRFFRGAEAQAAATRIQVTT